MSVQSEITRIQTARNTIRTKGVSLGIALATDDISDLATKIDAIVDRGTPSAEVQEGQTYTINPGYYHGGTVQGVGGGGSYTLQAKTATPTKSNQAISPDTGYYGLSSVIVSAISDIYQDVSSVTATAGDVLATKVIVTSDGAVTTGTMQNRGAVSQSLNCGESYTIPVGYHNGSGTVTANSLASQTGVDEGKTAATSKQIVSGYQAWVNGEKISGTITDHGTITATITGLGSVSGDTSYTIAGGFYTGGTVSLTSDIETALAAI